MISTKYHLLLVDLMMPHVSGLELCHTLKSNPITDHIPIILLTAKADEGTKIQGLEYGADDYITKPFDKSELPLKIRNFIALREKLHLKYAQNSHSDEKIPEPEPLDPLLQNIHQIVMEAMGSRDFSVPDLCRELGMSRTQVHSKIKALTGISTSLYVRSIRLESAIEYLRDTSLSISEVSFKTGFSSPSFFSKVFREKYGMRPKEWRENKQSAASKKKQ